MPDILIGVSCNRSVTSLESLSCIALQHAPALQDNLELVIQQQPYTKCAGGRPQDRIERQMWHQIDSTKSKECGVHRNSGSYQSAGMLN